MVRRTADDDGSNNRDTNRRTFMKTVGLAATAATGTAMVTGSGSASTVVDLGEEGLSDGDNIDSYISEHFTSGNEVHIPAGEYEYTGSGIGGSKSDCALIGDPEGVTFHRPGTDAVIRPTLWATDGTVRLENITIRGKRGVEQSRWRVGAASGATVEVVNVNMPDGTVEGSDSTGLYAGTDHAGTLVVRHCYFSDFGNVALYVSDPYVDGNGQVIAEHCDFVNTGMSAVRFAPDNSELRDCYFEATERASSSHVGWNQRGIKIDDPGDDVVIEDSDFVWTDAGNMPINFHRGGEGGTGVMRNLRIQNDGDTETFIQQWDVGGNWEGENIHLTGDGSHNAPSSFETVTGSDAQSPNDEHEIWTPEGEESSIFDRGATAAGETADEETDEDSEDESGEDPDRITIDGQTVVHAEEPILGGDTLVRTVHDGYTGEGFIDPEPRTGGTIEWPLDVATGGEYDVVFRFSQGDDSDRTADLVVNGAEGQITFEPTGSWDTWETMAVTMTLEEGENDILLETTGEDAGHIDTVEFIPAELGEEDEETEEDETTDDDDEDDEETETPTETPDDGDEDEDDDGEETTTDDPPTLDKVLLIDGTGDAVETAQYRFTVTGEVERSEEHTEEGTGQTPWDDLPDYINDGRVVGIVGSGVDAYSYSGDLSDIEIRGKATFAILRP